MTAEGSRTNRKGRHDAQRVLVADDDHLIATALASSLTSLGYEPLGPAPNGEAALELADQQAPDLGVDLAVLDIAMPGINGLEAARRLWERHNIPSLIVSAYSEESYLEEVDSSWGIFGYLLKPVAAENLRVAMAVAWRRSMIERERSGRISQLEQNLKNRQLVERAKWRLVEDFGLREADAHAKLQKAARDSRTTLAAVASEALQCDTEKVRAMLQF